MATHLPHGPFAARADAVAERLDHLRRRRDDLSRGRAADDVDMARCRATNAAVMSAAAHDRLAEHYESASITDPRHADAHRRAAISHRAAGDADLHRAFDGPGPRDDPASPG